MKFRGELKSTVKDNLTGARGGSAAWVAKQSNRRKDNPSLNLSTHFSVFQTLASEKLCEISASSSEKLVFLSSAKQIYTITKWLKILTIKDGKCYKTSNN